MVERKASAYLVKGVLLKSWTNDERNGHSRHAGYYSSVDGKLCWSASIARIGRPNIFREWPARLLSRQVHAAHEVLEAGIGTQAIPIPGHRQMY